MKKLFAFIFTASYLLQLSAQNWLPVGSGVGDTREIKALISYNGNLIAGGDFRAMGANTKTKRVAQWNGTEWQNMGAGFNGEVRAFAVFNNELYAGGNFDKDSSGSISYTGNIAKWNGSAWVVVAGADADNTDIRAMYVFKNKLHVTNMRYDQNIASVRPVISVFDGSSWVDLPDEFKGPLHYAYLYAIGEYKGNLVVAGVFDSVGSVAAHRVALWNDTVWKSLNLPVSGREQFTPSVIGLAGRGYAIKEHNDKLFLGGIVNNFVQNAGDTITPPLVSWNDTSWTAYRFDQNIGATVLSLQSINDTLYAMGEFAYTNNGNLEGGCVTLNTIASPPFNSLHFYNTSTNAIDVNASTIHNGNLYVGGKFSHAGTNAVNNIARFDPTPISTSISNLQHQYIKLYPNPAHNYFFIENANALRIHIFNILGEKIQTNQLEENTSIDIANMSSGVYFYQIEMNDKNLLKGKLIVE
jgi:hypothetical protein